MRVSGFKADRNENTTRMHKNDAPSAPAVVVANRMDGRDERDGTAFVEAVEEEVEYHNRRR